MYATLLSPSVLVVSLSCVFLGECPRLHCCGYDVNVGDCTLIITIISITYDSNVIIHVDISTVIVLLCQHGVSLLVT